MPDPSALYPQPPPQNQGFLTGDPSRTISALSQLNQLGQQIQLFGARKAIGDAWTLNPDGTPDIAATTAKLKSDPRAAILMPEATSNLLDQHGKVIENDTKAFAQYAGQSDFARTMLASLANKPNVSAEDIYNAAAAMSRNSDPRALPSSVISSWTNYVLNNPKGIKAGLTDLQNQAMGAASAAAPTVVAPTAAGAPQVGPLGAQNYGGTGARPVGQAPGEGDVQVASAARASNLQATADTTAQYHANLENLKTDSAVLANLGGPTIDVEKKLNQLSQRLGGFGITMNADQLRALESFDKIANQISTTQAGTLGAATDAGRHMVVGANPNSSMSRYGRDGVIDMLQGNQDAIDTTRKLWLNARAKGAPANSYDMFVNELSGTLDPRVFQFNRLSRANQQKFLSQVDPADLPEFERKYQEAIKRGWVKPLKAQ